MAQCPTCHSSNVVITEEVYTRKGRGYYRFLQSIFIFIIMIPAVALEQIPTGFLLAIGTSIFIWFLSLMNATRRAKSKTKITCLSCRAKHYL